MKIEKKTQDVLSEPGLIAESYTSKSGQKKRRFFTNPNAKVIKTITHYVVKENKVVSKDTVAPQKVGRRTSVEDTLKILSENNVDLKKKIKVAKAA